MKEKEMTKVADLLKRTIIGNESPEKVKRDVSKLIGGFQKVEYCFET
jgi:glycine/serine hydroxymethyltransferase